MTRNEFTILAKSPGYGYSDEEVSDILSIMDDELLRGFAFSMAGATTEEEYLEWYAKNLLAHY